MINDPHAYYVELAARVSEKNCIMCWEGRNTSCVSG